MADETHENPESSDQTETSYTFDCPRCGVEATLPFTPTNPDRVMCRECYRETDGKGHDMSRTAGAPRRKHGTRVAITIDCAKCGKQAQLDYAPKGVKLSELMCEGCVAEELGQDSKWAIVREAKERETRAMGQNEFKINCAQCGREDLIPGRKQRGREYLCQRCHHEQEQPDRSRLAGKQSLGGGVFVRRPKKSEGSDESDES